MGAAFVVMREVGEGADATTSRVEPVCVYVVRGEAERAVARLIAAARAAETEHRAIMAAWLGRNPQVASWDPSDPYPTRTPSALDPGYRANDIDEARYSVAEVPTWEEPKSRADEAKHGRLVRTLRIVAWPLVLVEQDVIRMREAARAAEAELRSAMDAWLDQNLYNPEGSGEPEFDRKAHPR